MHHYRYAFDICSPRSSSIQSKTQPVGFHKMPDSWVICGGFNVAVSCTTLTVLFGGLHQPTSVFLSSPRTMSRSNADLPCKLPATNHSLPASCSCFSLHSPRKLQRRKDWRKEEGTGRTRIMRLGRQTQESSERFISEISKQNVPGQTLAS